MSEQSFVKTAIDPVSKKNWLEREFAYSLTIGGRSVSIRVTLWAVITVLVVLVLAAIAIGFLCCHWRNIKK